jgi:hypothetical protein
MSENLGDLYDDNQLALIEYWQSRVSGAQRALDYASAQLIKVMGEEVDEL